MSAPETPADAVEAVAQEVVKAARGSTLPKVIVGICATAFLLVSAVLLTTRYGVLLPQGRLLIEARASGLKLGRFGKLRIEGLGGDVWSDFTIRRLTVSDEKGVWLEARNVAISWRYGQLLRRRLDADRIVAERLTLLRRPTLALKEKSRGLPISIKLDEVRTRVEMTPAFSYRRGVYDVVMSLDVQRANGGQKGKVAADSVLHRGDHLDAQFDFGGGRPLLLAADALEARGGALAGSLGLPADQPFALKARADGKDSSGRFTAVAIAGGAKPLEASGAWNAKGGSARGRVRLDASRLTQPLVARLGPEVVFSITGREAQGSLYDLKARASSANLTLDARGLGNLGERRLGLDGLAVVATAREVTKVTGGPSMGAGRVVGRLKGDLDDLRFVGVAEVAQLKLGGYGLDRVAGPVELTRRGGVLAVKAQISGTGGRGTGLAAALLGGRPTAAFDGARLADGRLLLRELDAIGVGLKVQASGGRGLVGGLNFKGKAQFSNLAAARAGASGALAADWSANQGGPGKPWTLSLEAQGARFASGFGELDRLLGAAPRLQARGNIDGRKVSVSQADLEGAALKAATAGVLDADGALRFKLDWSATGPFRAGPMEITGKARGSGAITGSLTSPRADLLADFDAIDLPRMPLKDARLTLSFMRRADGASGVATLAAASSYGPAAARSVFSFPRGGVDLTDLSVNAGGLTAQGSLALRRSTPSAADLQIGVGKGAFLESGQISGAVRIVDAAGGPRASLRLTAKDAVLPGARFAIGTGEITADGPLERLPYRAQLRGVATSGRWTLDGGGVLAQTKPGYQVAFDGLGRFGRRDLKTTETAVIGFGGAERTARLRLAASDGGQIDVDARLGRDAASIRAEVKKLGLGVLNEDLTGTADATLVLAGRGGRLDGTLDARFDDARGRGYDDTLGLDGTLRARLAGDTLSLDLDTTSPHGLRADANVVLPAETSAGPFRVAIARTRPIRGRFFAEGEVKPLWDLLMSGERALAGQVRLEGTLGGTLADPNAVGAGQMDRGQFTDGATGLALRDVTLRTTFADNAVNVTQATGADGHGGTVAGSGRISLFREGSSTLRLDLKGFRLIDNDQATGSASGQAVIDRAADGKVRLAGALTIDRADVAAKVSTPSGVVAMDVTERNKPADLASVLAPAVRKGAAIALDVSLKAPRRVFLRGRGLDVELSLDAHVGGTTARPALSGTARVVRGEYDFAGKRFEFDERGVVYLATSPQAIRLDLSATRDDPALTAVVRIRGTAAKPEITLTSSPVLPNDEVLSQVLFGRSASQLSPLEAAQLASALSSLAGGGGFDVIGNLRTFAGLDRLALAGGDASGVTVSGGKYLTEDVYLELTGGGREGPSAQVEWRVGRNLSIISKLAGQGDGKLAVRWRKDY
ncbi:translocation/assembly module TamB domain-containing protein [Phenylobacterium sp.]|uniref:translocation/assembly module TamB domain-containing protein n=1 Tax=Phenylobacterium sp. TaxID=1871053 RepID=UPI00273437BD|nr:translocation/assembly module TamB domain-containing protein [Phenylobacterium sp.]MDP3854642.1 translocation/assembly module TamB domain-containing protein [Phenylobacterium sp.]